MRIYMDKGITREDLYSMDEEDLAKLFMYTDKDKDTEPTALKVYWWCVDEINRRLDCGEISIED